MNNNEQQDSNWPVEKFLELQFTTLRKEIEEAKSREFKLMIGGPAIIPAIMSVAGNYEIGFLMLSLPFIVTMYVLIFSFVRNSAMRCGCYIREEIEPKVPKIVGWEAWLEKHVSGLQARRAEKHLVIAFIILAFIYYLSSTIIASSFALNKYGTVAFIVSLWVYIPQGILTFIISITKSSTR